jgi:two-component system, sensor histidine kinase and response regulator
MKTILQFFNRLFTAVRSIGVTPGMDEYEKIKLSVFNILNAMGMMNGIVIPVAGLFNDDKLPVLAWVVACSPAVISFLVLLGNHFRRYEMARMCYFIFYPVLTSLVYLADLDLGIELFFVFYAVLAVFLMKKIVNVLLSLSLSMSLYFIVFVLWRHYDYRLVQANYGFYIFNQALAIVFIFCCLYLFKRENHGYQFRLLRRNGELQDSKQEIEEQKRVIEQKAMLLETQTRELRELDAVKNKLFSVIGHDLRTPMYALRNMFRNVQQYDLPAHEIKAMIPDVVTDLNYTTGLMENLLQWAKSQMQADAMKPQLLDVSSLVNEVMQLLRLQADAKKVYLENKLNQPVYIYADRDMVNLVLRNLLSNAIKFTPEQGRVSIDAYRTSSFVEVLVEDTGTGMNEETLQKINGNNYFTTKGTSNEAGTGLGLMLCKEFLAKNGGRMYVESEVGRGSTFSFTLPSAN